jgi:hypothetical protein
MAKKENSGGTFHFKIEKYTPYTLPMARLAEYMADLAALLGHEDHVHFIRVGEGSADLIHQVEEQEQSQVVERLHLVKQGLGPIEAQKAFRQLNAKLREDGTAAKMIRGRGKLLTFPGADSPPPAIYGPIVQPGTLEGKLIKIGGKDETKPVHIMDKDRYYICNANAEVAKRLSTAYEENVRVYGVGRWSRCEDGRWSLDHFNINDFEVLESETLKSVVGKLREITNNGWRSVDDPLGELASIRHGGKVN